MEDSNYHNDVGECKGAKQYFNCTDWDKSGKAKIMDSFKDTMMFVQDGSDYRANLYTRPTFFCSSWKEIT
jgi:hypothetical protein